MTADLETAAAGGREALMERWAARHGVAAAQRLADAEDLADAVAREITPTNTTSTYGKSWRVWERYCASAGMPLLAATRGCLVAYVTWMLREGRADGSGYAPASASTHLAATVVGLRQRGVHVDRDDQAAARIALEGLTVRLLQAGERRGRGKAAAATRGDLRRVVAACPATLAGYRDRALILTSLHYAARASEPAGLLVSDLTLHERGLVVDVVTGKTRHSVRTARIVRQDDAVLCPVVAWETYRTRLAEEADERWTRPEAPAWVGIDRWGHVTGGMTPDSITRAIRRASTRAGVRIAWTGHSLRIGHATLARQRGVDTTLIADQGGWARHSRALAGYIQHEDGWDTTSSNNLT